MQPERENLSATARATGSTPGRAEIGMYAVDTNGRAELTDVAIASPIQVSA
jgi:hypothetical protein